MYQVWTGLVLKNTDPLCDPLAAVFGKIDITVLLNFCDRMDYYGLLRLEGSLCFTIHKIMCLNFAAIA